MKLTTLDQTWPCSVFCGLTVNQVDLFIRMHVHHPVQPEEGTVEVMFERVTKITSSVKCALIKCCSLIYVRPGRSRLDRLRNPFKHDLHCPFFPLWKQTQHHRERRSGGHVWKGYREYYFPYSVDLWYTIDLHERSFPKSRTLEDQLKDNIEDLLPLKLFQLEILTSQFHGSLEIYSNMIIVSFPKSKEFLNIHKSTEFAINEYKEC